MNIMTLNFRAVLAGVVVDLVGMIIASAIFVTVFVTSMSARGLSDEEITALLSNPAESTLLMGVLLLIGVVFDGVAGYVTALKAGYLEYWHVLAMLGLLVVIQLAMGGSGPELPATIYAISYLGGGAAAFYGAWLVKNKRSSGS